MTGSTLLSLHRTGSDTYELHDLSARRRWRLTSEAWRRLDLADESGLTARLGMGHMSARKGTIFRAGIERGWTVGAYYVAGADDYPFFDYARDGFAEDRRRMKRYGDEAADAERSVKAGAKRLELAIDHAGMISLGPVADVVLTTFGVTRKFRPRWRGESIHLRTSPSGGSRHPANGYLIPAGRTDALYLDPLDNSLRRSPLRARHATNHDRVLITLSPARNRYRYREPRTFRTIFMDVGHLLQTLRVSSSAFGFESHFSPLIFPRIDLIQAAALFGGDLLDELPIVVCDLLPRQETAHSPPACDHVDEFFSPRRTAVHTAGALSIMAATGMEHIIASTVAGVRRETADGASKPAMQDLARTGLVNWVDDGWALAKDMLFTTPANDSRPPLQPCALQGGASMIALYSRRTTRKFRAAPIRRHSLLSLLKAPEVPETFRQYVIAFSVEDLEPGVYRWSEGRLDQVRREGESSLRTLTEAGIQGQPAPRTAGVMLCATVDLDHAVRRTPGDESLYHMWIEAGSIAQAWLIRAEQLDMAGMPTPAVEDSLFDELLGLRVGRQACVHTVTLGPKVR